MICKTPHELIIKIKTTMLERDINTNELAQLLNTSPQNLSRMLKAENPKLSTLFQICNALHLKIDLSLYE